MFWVFVAGILFLIYKIFSYMSNKKAERQIAADRERREQAWRSNKHYSEILGNNKQNTDVPLNEKEKMQFFTITTGHYEDRQDRKNDPRIQILKGLDAIKDEFVVFDVETTGLSPQNDNIIEIGAVKVNLSKNTADEYQSFILINRALPKEIISLTGITDDMLRGGKEVNIVMSEFRGFAGKLPLIAHNASFDASFLLSEADRCGFSFLNKFIDTMALARKHLPSMPNYKLKTLVSELNIQIDGVSHRALSDAKNTLELYKILLEKLKEAEAEEFAVKFRDENRKLIETIAYIVKADNLFSQKEKQITMDLFKSIEKSEMLNYAAVNKKIFTGLGYYMPKSDRAFKLCVNEVLKKYDIDLFRYAKDIVATQKTTTDRENEILAYLEKKTAKA